MSATSGTQQLLFLFLRYFYTPSDILTMKSASLAALVCLKLFPAVATWDVFEPPDFNVTTTLLDKGVDITSIVLYEEILLSFRRLDPCSIAVSDTIDTNSAPPTFNIVHRDCQYLWRNQGFIRQTS